MAGNGVVDETDRDFLYHMTALEGNNAVVTTKTGDVYEGVYVAFTSKLEVVLEAGHLLRGEKKGKKNQVRILEHFKVVNIASSKVASMKMTDVDMSSATKDFATDGAIGGGRRNGSKPKELTPWEGDDGDSSKDFSLGAGSSPGSGWEAKDMFKQNQEKYGVVSTFTPDLKGYTTSVNKRDKQFKKLEEQACQVAHQIENRPKKWELRNQLENDDEETAFSAVVRHPKQNTAKSPPHSAKRPIPPPPPKSYQPPKSPVRGQSQPASKSPPTSHAPQLPAKNLKATAQGPSQLPSNGVKLPAPALGDTGGKKVTSDPIHRRPGIINSDTVRRPPADPRGPPPPTLDDKSLNSPRVVKHVTFDIQEPAKQNEFKKPFTLPSSDSSQQKTVPPSTHGTTAPVPPQKGGPSSGGDAVLGSPAFNTRKKEESPPTSVVLPPPKIDTCPPSTAVNLGGAVPPEISYAAALSASPKVSPTKNDAVLDDFGNKTPPCYISGVDSPASPDPPTTNADAEVKKKPIIFNPNAKEFCPNSFAYSPRSPSPPSQAPTGPPSMITQIPDHSLGAAPTHFAEMPTFYAITPPPASPMSPDGTAFNPAPYQIPSPIPIPGSTVPAFVTPAEPMQAVGHVAQAAQYFVPHSQTPMMQAIPQQVRTLPVIPAQGWSGGQVPQFLFLQASPNGASPPNMTAYPFNPQMAGPPNPWTAPHPRDNPWFRYPL